MTKPKEYIEREATLRNLADDLPYKGSVKRVLMQAPAADVVEISVLKDWLYEIAINNVGVVLNGDFSNACEEIIARLDGLREFARERKEQG